MNEYQHFVSLTHQVITTNLYLKAKIERINDCLRNITNSDFDEVNKEECFSKVFRNIEECEKLIKFININKDLLEYICKFIKGKGERHELLINDDKTLNNIKENHESI